MSQNIENKYSESDSEPGDSSRCDGKTLWTVWRRYRVWFVVSALLCFLLAFAYLWYATPQYKVFAKVLMTEPEPASYQRAATGASAEQEHGLEDAKFYNEVEVIATKTLNKKVVKDLKLYTKYAKAAFLKDEEMERESVPYWVDIQEDMLDSLICPIKLVLYQTEAGVEVEVKTDAEEMEQTVTTFPATIPTPYGDVKLEKNPQVSSSSVGDKWKVVIAPLEEAALAYTASLSVVPTSNATTVVELSFLDNLPHRSCDYLNKLVDIYNEEVTIERNIYATRTQDFIDERLNEISKDLNATAAELKQYKHDRGLAAYKADGTIDATQQVLQEQKLVEIGTQIDLVNYLIEYCNDKHNELQIVPADIGLNNEQLNAQIAQYNEAIQERNRLLKTGDSAAVEAATQEAESLFATLRSALQTTKNQAVVQRNELMGQQTKDRNGVPTSRGRALADINRLQEVKVGLYLMLLQKREENLLLMSSASNRAKLIEEPTVIGPVLPNKMMVLIGALVVGLLIPYIIYYIRQSFPTS